MPGLDFEQRFDSILVYLGGPRLRRIMKVLTRRRFFPREREYLNKQFVGRIATAIDNIPHVTPVRYAFKHEKIYINTGRRSKKIRNLKKNNKVAFVVDDYASCDDVKRARGVFIEGEAEILESGKDYEFGRRLIHDKYASLKGFRIIAHKDRVIIVINPSKVLSWGL